MSDDLSAMWQPLKSVPIARQRGTRDGISTTFQHFRHVGNNEFPGFIFLFFFLQFLLTGRSAGEKEKQK